MSHFLLLCYGKNRLYSYAGLKTYIRNKICQLIKVICKSHHWFKRYRADTKYSHRMFNLRL